MNLLWNKSDDNDSEGSLEAPSIRDGHQYFIHAIDYRTSPSEPPAYTYDVFFTDDSGGTFLGAFAEIPEAKLRCEGYEEIFLLEDRIKELERRQSALISLCGTLLGKLEMYVPKPPPSRSLESTDYDIIQSIRECFFEDFMPIVRKEREREEAREDDQISPISAQV